METGQIGNNSERDVKENTKISLSEHMGEKYSKVRGEEKEYPKF